MLSSLSFRLDFIFSINSLISSGFQSTSFHLTEANLIPRATLKKLKTSFLLFSYSEKMRWGKG